MKKKSTSLESWIGNDVPNISLPVPHSAHGHLPFFWHLHLPILRNTKTKYGKDGSKELPFLEFPHQNAKWFTQRLILIAKTRIEKNWYLRWIDRLSSATL